MVTTKQGDKGFTQLADGNRVIKYSVYCTVCGTIDEFTSFLGLAKVDSPLFISKEIETIQTNLQKVCTYLSCVGLTNPFDGKLLTQLEEKRISLERRVELPRGFIIPGDTKISAILDIARTVCRRAEREAVKIFKGKNKPTDTTVLIYLNRLSDYIYLLARFSEGRIKH